MGAGSLAEYGPTIFSAAQQQGVPPDVLAAVLLHESGLNPTAINVDSNGTEDRGIAQLNSAYYSAALAANPTASIQQAASILASHYSQCGSWAAAIAAYNLGHCGSNAAYVSAVAAQQPTAAAYFGQTATSLEPEGEAAGSASGSGSASGTGFLSWIHQYSWVLILPGLVLAYLGIKVLIGE